MEFKPNYPLSELTTFRIGGPASFFVEVENESDLKEALDFANSKNLQVLVIGGGSNLLASDEGFNGLVIRNKIKNFTVEGNGEVVVGTGENWDEVVARVVGQNLAGIECLSGVPGSAGGAVVQNIGAYGQTIGDLVLEVKATEVATGKEKIFSATECEFSYRNSWFKKNPNKYMVTSFKLALKPDAAATVTYPDIKNHFPIAPTLSEVRDYVIEVRASKGYLIMPGHGSFNTAGSFFKNPIVTEESYERLKEILGDPTLNRFWQTSNGVKLAAAFLMQEAGFGKGYRIGNAGISPKHSLSLVNFGGASSADIKALANQIKKSVNEKFGVELEEEVLFV